MVDVYLGDGGGGEVAGEDLFGFADGEADVGEAPLTRATTCVTDDDGEGVDAEEVAVGMEEGVVEDGAAVATTEVDHDVSGAAEEGVEVEGSVSGPALEGGVGPTVGGEDDAGHGDAELELDVGRGRGLGGVTAIGHERGAPGNEFGSGNEEQDRANGGIWEGESGGRGKGYTYLYDSNNDGFGYDQRYIYVFGLPNIGNGGYNGKWVQPSKGIYWADWRALRTAAQGAGPGPGGFQEIDMDVKATTLLRGNYNYCDKGVRASESLHGMTLPKSLYLTAKPSWFGKLSWPAFGPDTGAFEKNKIPAQVRFGG